MIRCACGTDNSEFNPACLRCGQSLVFAEAIDPVKLPAGFTLERLLDGGSVGRVYAARTEDGQACAVKLLHPHHAANEEIRRRFAREARALQSIDHPNVARIRQVVEEHGQVALVLELIEGQSLRARMDEGRIELRQLIQWLLQLCDALSAIHANGWLHRDVKPENIMLSAPPQVVRLLDFGLARNAIPSGESVGTAGGVFVGSLAYASPEQILGESIGPHSDLWSLGVIIYEAVSGARPFAGESRADLSSSIFCHEPEPLSSPLGGLVTSLLEKDFSDRPTADGVMAQLRRISSERDV